MMLARSTIVSRYLLFALVSLGLALPVFGDDETSADTNQFDVTAVLQRHAILAGEFEQTQHVPGLVEPLHSNGEFIVVSGKGLLWRILAPMQQEVVLAANARKRGSGRIHRLVLELMNGDLLSDRRFEASLSGDADSWQLDLQPTNRRMKRYLQAIVLTGDEHVRMVQMHMQQDQVLQINFTSVAPMTQLPAEDCRLLGLSQPCVATEESPDL